MPAAQKRGAKMAPWHMEPKTSRLSHSQVGYTQVKLSVRKFVVFFFLGKNAFVYFEPSFFGG